MMVSALLCLFVLVIYAGARRGSDLLGNPPWASPVLVAAVIVTAALWLTGVPVAVFDAATMPLRWLLGPGLVALALVIDANRALLRRRAAAVLVAVVGGTLVGVASAVGLAQVLGLAPMLRQAVVTKTVSTPFAVAIQTMVGGPVALAAALAVVTGVIGALLVPVMFDRLRIGGTAGRALGMGVSSHIVGTDWLTRRDARAGGMAALGMVLAGTLAALVLPAVWRVAG